MKPLYPALFLAAFTLGGCDKKKDLELPKIGSGDVSKETGELKNGLASKAAKERREFIAMVERERAELGARVEVLKKEAAQAKGNAKAELDAQIAKLEQEQKIAEQTLVEMRTAIGEKWSALRVALIESIERMKLALDSVKSGA